MNHSRSVRFYVMLAVLLVLLTAGTTSLVYFRMHEKSYLSYPNSPFTVLNSPVRRGAAVRLFVIRCNSDNYRHDYEVTHRLISLTDPALIPFIMPSYKVSLEPGCHASESGINEIPGDRSRGWYYIEGTGVTQGRTQTFEVPWRSDPFEVTE